MKKLFTLIWCAMLAMGSINAQDEMATFRQWALTPPMGWNSWDCYYSSVTEKEVMQNAQYLVDNDLVGHLSFTPILWWRDDKERCLHPLAA